MYVTYIKNQNESEQHTAHSHLHEKNTLAGMVSEAFFIFKILL